MHSDASRDEDGWKIGRKKDCYHLLHFVVVGGRRRGEVVVCGLWGGVFRTPQIEREIAACCWRARVRWVRWLKDESRLLLTRRGFIRTIMSHCHDAHSSGAERERRPSGPAGGALSRHEEKETTQHKPQRLTFFILTASSSSLPHWWRTSPSLSLSLTPSHHPPLSLSVSLSVCVCK